MLAPAAIDSLTAAGASQPPDPNGSPGPVESAVAAEVGGLAAEVPGLAQVALCMARLLDNPKAVNQQFEVS